MARELWSSLGISNIIEEAIIIDLSGSAVLEYLFHDQDRELPGFERIGQKETIGVACSAGISSAYVIDVHMVKRFFLFLTAKCISSLYHGKCIKSGLEVNPSSKPLGQTQCETNQGKCWWFFSSRGTCRFRWGCDPRLRRKIHGSVYHIHHTCRFNVYARGYACQ
jgi:hypothetical protein